MDEAIRRKLDELIELFEGQEEVSRYQEVVKQMEKNKDLQAKIAEYKKQQQKVVLYENKHDDLPRHVEEKLDELYDALLDIPIFNEYSSLLYDINEVLQQMVLILETEINRGLPQDQEST